MPTRPVSIAQVMMVVALVALNLLVARSVAPNVAPFPTVWAFLGIVDLVIFWKVIGRRPLRAFHYTFLFVFVATYWIMAYHVAEGRFHPLGPFVRWYQQRPGVGLNGVSTLTVRIGQFWAACLLALVAALPMGSLAAWLEKRRGWDIAAGFRGLLVGLGNALFLLIAADRLSTWRDVPPLGPAGRLTITGPCVVAGVWIGLSRLRSRTPAPDGPGSHTAIEPAVPADEPMTM